MRLRSLPAGINATASQALSSVRSFAFLIIAARMLTSEDFGFVAIVTTAAIALNEVLRATASHPLALVYGEVPIDDDRPLASAATLHLLLAGGISGLVAAALVVIGSADGALVIGSLMYVAVAWLDALRTGSINRGRSDRSVLIDGSSIVVLLIVLPVVLDRSPTASAALLVWGSSAAATAIVTTMLCGLRLSARSAATYWRQARGVGRSLALQVGLESIPTRLAPLLIAAMVGVEAAGSIRGAEVLLGGAAMVYSGVAAASLRQARQEFVTATYEVLLRNAAKRFGWVLVAIAVNLAFVSVLPDRVGTAVLGESWSGASDLAPVQALVLSSLVVLAAISVVMRAALAMLPLVRLGVIGAALTVVLVPSATALGGASLGLAMIAVAVFGMVIVGARWVLRFDPAPIRI